METLKHIPKEIVTKSVNKWYPIYLERAKICQSDFGITVFHEDGTKTDIPVGICSAIMLGPGTSITHGAISICAETNCTLHWVGENGLIYYAIGHEATFTNKNALKQISYRTDKKKRYSIAEKLLLKRFPNAEIKEKTIESIMGVEGSLVKDVYHKLGEKYGVSWKGRKFDHNNFDVGDKINKAISIANFSLYSACFSVIFANGFLPSIGFVHNGTMIDFSLDIADVYKNEIAMESAFQSISQYPDLSAKNLKEVLNAKMDKMDFFKISSEFLGGLFE